MTTTSSGPAKRDPSPGAIATAAWFKRFARALRVSRLYRADNALVVETSQAVTSSLAELLDEHKTLDLSFSPNEIRLGSEPVVRVTEVRPGQELELRPTDQIPFLFYRDGVRRLTLTRGAPPEEMATLIGILRTAFNGSSAQDDLVTLLWQAGLPHVRLEAVPLEQTIFVSSRAGGAAAGGTGDTKGHGFAQPPSGTELRAELGQVVGPQGLHRDTFDDWALPDHPADVATTFERLEPEAEAARLGFLATWEAENATDWTLEAPRVLRGLHTMDRSEDMSHAIARAAITWLAAAVSRLAWEEAQQALTIIEELDPDRAGTADELAAALAALDVAALADRLDEGEDGDKSRFAALAAALGPPAVGFCVEVVARADKARARAAVVTALCYMCAEDPALLAPWLNDSRWRVVRNVVFTLGHIGGPGVAPLLAQVARHAEPRVRRQLVQALGSVPLEERKPLLLDQLDTRDSQLLSATLHMLARDRDPQIARAILGCIQAPDFESREEGNQRALFGALSDVADDSAVPVLNAILHKGGWFARRTFQRSAAARTLRQIGTPPALAALHTGARTRSEAVRSACIEALGLKEAA